jgi:hypothetical protein
MEGSPLVVVVHGSACNTPSSTNTHVAQETNTHTHINKGSNKEPL